MTLGRVNASARNTTSGLSWRSALISHSQKAIGLVWGLSTRKIRTPRSDQKSMIALHASHRATRSASSAGQKLIG